MSDSKGAVPSPVRQPKLGPRKWLREPKRRYIEQTEIADDARHAGLLWMCPCSHVQIFEDSLWSRPNTSVKIGLKGFESRRRRVHSGISVDKIDDRSNPAHLQKGVTCVADRIAADTILGIYGGIIKRAIDCDEESNPPEYRGRQIELMSTRDWGQDGRDSLVVDGNHACNELAMVNDYRTNTKQYNDPTMQEREANARMLEVQFPDEQIPCIVFISLQELKKGTEVLIDYGNKYWELKQAESKTHPRPQRWPDRLGAEPTRSNRRTRSATSVLVENIVLDVKCFLCDHDLCSDGQKDLLLAMLGTIYCDTAWEKGNNMIADALARKHSFSIVLCWQGRAVAAVVFYQTPQRLGVSSCSLVVIRMLGTHPNCRRKGCGRLINALVHQHCERARINTVAVEVSIRDALAQKIWMKWGYDRWSRHRRGVFDSTATNKIFKNTELLMMSTHIDAGDTKAQAMERLQLIRQQNPSLANQRSSSSSDCSNDDQLSSDDDQLSLESTSDDDRQSSSSFGSSDDSEI
eukprot:SAG31_NODE_3094_length_4682_cov_26.831333_2_plen_520_part_00